MNDDASEDRDVGLVALDRVWRSMLIDDEWSVREQRGFAWWSGSFAQTITVSEPVLSYDLWVSRLDAITLVASGVPRTATTLAVLDHFNASGRSLSALGFTGDGVVGLVAAATVHEQMLEFAPRWLSFAAVTQAADAQTLGHELAASLGGRPFETEHPTSGPRPDLDGALDIYPRIVQPAASEPSRFIGKEMLDVLEMLQKSRLFAHGDETRVMAYYPYPGSASLLDVDPTIVHPALGAGLWLKLKIPLWLDAPQAAEVACAMNQREASSDVLHYVAGGWHVADDGSIACSVFCPNAIFQPGLGTHLAGVMAVRGEWVGSMSDPRDRKERFESMYDWILQHMEMTPDS